MTDDEKRRLDTDGYLVLEKLMDDALLEQVRVRVEQLFEQEGDSAGSEFKQEPHSRRLANLVDKGEIFERIIQTPRVLECMEHVLGPRFKLSSLNIRSADPDNGWSQPLHADSGAIADAEQPTTHQHIGVPCTSTTPGGTSRNSSIRGGCCAPKCRTG